MDASLDADGQAQHLVLLCFSGADPLDDKAAALQQAGQLGHDSRFVRNEDGHQSVGCRMCWGHGSPAFLWMIILCKDSPGGTMGKTFSSGSILACRSMLSELW